METTANLQLPYIMPSQAQKHVTYNEAIRHLDTLVQLAVLDRDVTDPPASPTDGDRYLVPVDGTGNWAGKEGKIATWQDGAWAFLTPRTGWLLWIGDEEQLVAYDGSDWQPIDTGGLNPASLVGVNAVADTINRLTVRSPSVLFDQEAGDHRLKINKAGSGDTASLIFSDGHSGRAEIGLAGDDDWQLKISTDGAFWTTAIRVSSANGRVTLPTTLPLEDDDQIATRRHVRDRLTTDRTYYIRTDGSDSNDGLVDSTSGAFLTIQKALDIVLGTLDLGGHNITISVAPGLYAEPVDMLAAQVGSGRITIRGNVTAPSDVTVGPVTVDGAGCRLFLEGLNVSKGTGQFCVNVKNGGYVKTTGKNRFSSTSGGHNIVAENGGVAEFGAPEEVQGVVAGGHYFCQTNGVIFCQGASWTASGSFSCIYFAYCQTSGVIFAFGNSSTGTFNGGRYSASLNGVIQTNGGGASYFPGSSSGSTTTGGQYA